jgi:hypothetical protein
LRIEFRGILALLGVTRALSDGGGSLAALRAEEFRTMKIGRNAGTGRFTPVRVAQAKPKTHVVETVKPGPKKRR